MWVLWLACCASLVLRICAIPLFDCPVLDLTQTLEKSNPALYPLPAFNLTERQKGSNPLFGGFAAFNSYSTYEHVGTHIDAPYHVSENGATVDKLPLENMMGEACVIDISAKRAANADYMLTKKDILDWEDQHGKLGDHCVVIVNTGQYKLFGDARKYFATDNPDVQNMAKFHFTSFSPEAANFLTSERKIKGVGVDAPSLDGPREPLTAHRYFLKTAGIPGYENLANLDALPPRGAIFFGIPMKIGGGTGSQVRAFAIGWSRGSKDSCRFSGGISPSAIGSLTLLLTAVAATFV